jgi:hypothetical protein
MASTSSYHREKRRQRKVSLALGRAVDGKVGAGHESAEHERKRLEAEANRILRRRRARPQAKAQPPKSKPKPKPKRKKKVKRSFWWGAPKTMTGQRP